MRALELRNPPLAVVLIAAFLMWLIATWLPSLRLIFAGRVPLAAGIAILGVLIVLAGFIEFRRARTTVNPMKPAESSALVVGGIYKRTRNPMYLGFGLMLLAWVVFLANPVALAVLPVFVAYMNRFQIIPEEKALVSMFASDFQAYCARVRRWL